MTEHARSLVLLAFVYAMAACAPVVVRFQDLYDSGMYETLVQRGDIWLERHSQAEPGTRDAVFLLTARAEQQLALQADTESALRAYRQEYQKHATNSALGREIQRLLTSAFLAEANAAYRDRPGLTASPQRLQAFQREYENTAAATRARVREGELAWEAARALGTGNAARDWRQRFGSIPQLANIVAESWQVEMAHEFDVATAESVRSDREASLREFVRQYAGAPESASWISRAQRALAELGFLTASEADTVEAWTGFIAEFEGTDEAASLVDEARIRVVERAFQNAIEANTLDGWLEFRARYTDAHWREQAELRIRDWVTSRLEAYMESGATLDTATVDALLELNAENVLVAEAIASVRPELDDVAAAGGQRESLRLVWNLGVAPERREAVLSAYDAALWRDAQQVGDEEGWANYLRLLPEGPRALDAEHRLRWAVERERADERGAVATIEHVQRRDGMAHIYVRVRDCRGQTVVGLSDVAFRVFSEGELVPIEGFLGIDSDRPVEVSFAIDLSGSMATERTAVRTAIRRFVDKFRYRWREVALGLVTFHESIESSHAPQGSVSRFEGWLDELSEADGGSLGEDSVGALLEASRSLRANDERVIVLLSDEPMQLNEQGRRHLRYASSSDVCLRVQAASNCLLEAETASAVRNCARAVDRISEVRSREAQDFATRCTRGGNVEHCRRQLLSALSEAGRVCAEPVGPYSSTVDDITEYLERDFVRAFFIVAPPNGGSAGTRQNNAWERVSRAAGGRTIYFADDTASVQPYVDGLLQIAESLATQYVIKVPLSALPEGSLHDLEVITRPEYRMRQLASLDGEQVEQLVIGGEQVDCPVGVALTRSGRTYRTANCGQAWEALDESDLTRAVADGTPIIDSVVVPAPEARRASEWPEAELLAVGADGTLYGFGVSGELRTIGGVEGVSVRAVTVDGYGTLWGIGTDDTDAWQLLRLEGLGAPDAGAAEARSRTTDSVVLDTPFEVAASWRIEGIADGDVPRWLLLPRPGSEGICLWLEAETRWCVDPDTDVTSEAEVRGLQAGDASGRVTALNLSSADVPVELVAVDGRGVFRSVDGGQHFRRTLEAEPGEGVRMTSGEGPLVCASLPDATFCSEDSGLSWFPMGYQPLDGRVTASGHATVPALWGDQLYQVNGTRFERAMRLANREVPATQLLFATGSDTPQEEAGLFLEELVRLVDGTPDVLVRVEGHADARGSDEFNLELSQRRAQVVADELVALGLDPARVETVAFGEERPMRAGQSARDLARNRRVELVLLRAVSDAGWFASDCGEGGSCPEQCSGDDLIGSWGVDVERTLASLPAELRQVVEEDILQGLELVFRDDGGFDARTGTVDGFVMSGSSWEVLERTHDTLHIQVTQPSGDPILFEVRFVARDRFVLSENDQAESLVFVQLP